MKDPDFLMLADVLAAHHQQLEQLGGSGGIDDQGSLESAVAMSQVTFGGQFVHDNLFLMAAAYAFHIAENQPFVDGNKRTGLASALAFLRINGFKVKDPQSKLYDAMIDISKRKLDKSELAVLLKELSVKYGT